MDPDPIQLASFPDIVMDVLLSYLKVQDLLSCRLASKFWNQAASSVLRRRSVAVVSIYNKADLIKLEDCMTTSSKFPFAGLELHHRQWIFGCGSERALKFFQNHGENFTHLRLRTGWTRGMQDLAPFLNHLHRLSVLEIHLSTPNPLVEWSDTDYSDVDSDLDDEDILSTPDYRVEWMDHGETDDSKILKLPSVRTIKIMSDDKLNEDLLLEILTTVSPSVRIECWTVNPKIMRTLKSAGRLRAVSVMKFVEEYKNKRKKWRTRMDQFLSNELPSLSILVFHGQGSLSLDKLEQILYSSQHTLRELYLDGWRHCEFPWDKFPVLPKLNLLSMSDADDSLFCGRHGQNFPALKEVHLYFDCGIKTGIKGPGYSSNLFVVPSVTRLELHGYVEEHGMERLAQSFPNVIDMRVDYPSYERDPSKIWSVGAFQCLEKLRIWRFLCRQVAKDYINMDSFLTGIPFEICETLRKGGQVSLTNSPPDEVLRNKASIVKLEHLKELVVCVSPGHRLEELPEHPPFVSMVSVWYALEVMPNLRVKFLYKPPSCGHKEEEKSRKFKVLEAVFKHVQPSIKLERFYY